jgi:hypothetical protein
LVIQDKEIKTMATQKNENVSKVSNKGISFASKFGLDKDRHKLGAVTNEKSTPPTVAPMDFGGEGFLITKITEVDSKKRYSVTNEDTNEIIKVKIPIVQFDVIHADGSKGKYYSPNSAIVEACENIMADPDFRYNKATGELGEPALINTVIAGKGENKRDYIAFQ